MKCRIFKGNWETALTKCLKAGYSPAYAHEVFKLDLPKDLWYNTSTFAKEGKIKNVNLKSVEQLKKLFDTGWRSWGIDYLSDTYIFDSYRDLKCSWHLVGVKK